MGCFTFNSCWCLSLRVASYVIAFVSLIFEVISLMINSVIAKYAADTVTEGHLGSITLLRFLVFLSMLLMVIKVVLCIALFTGLSKKLPDHLQLWYQGYIFCLLIEIGIAGVSAVNSHANLRLGPAFAWTVFSKRIIIILIEVMFVVVVRSYYYKMQKEDNYYKTLLKPSPYEKDDLNRIYESVEDTKPAKYDYVKGGEVYAAAPRIYTQNEKHVTFDDKQTSMLYPSLN